MIALNRSLDSCLIGENMSRGGVIASFRCMSDCCEGLGLSRGVGGKAVEMLTVNGRVEGRGLLGTVMESGPVIRFAVYRKYSSVASCFGKVRGIRLVPFIRRRRLQGCVTSSSVSLGMVISAVKDGIVMASVTVKLTVIYDSINSVRSCYSRAGYVFYSGGSVGSFDHTVTLLSSSVRGLLLFGEGSVRRDRGLAVRQFCSRVVRS